MVTGIAHGACFAAWAQRWGTWTRLVLGPLASVSHVVQVAECLGLKKGEQAVDLHGLSSLEARAAVLCVLSFVQQRAARGEPLEPHLTFITGASAAHESTAISSMQHEAMKAVQQSPDADVLLRYAKHKLLGRPNAAGVLVRMH